MDKCGLFQFQVWHLHLAAGAMNPQHAAKEALSASETGHPWSAKTKTITEVAGALEEAKLTVKLSVFNGDPNAGLSKHEASK